MLTFDSRKASAVHLSNTNLLGEALLFFFKCGNGMVVIKPLSEMETELFQGKTTLRVTMC